MQPARLFSWLGLAALLATPAAAEPLLVRYEVRVRGLLVAQVEATLDLAGPRYAVKTSSRTLGVASVFAGSEQVAIAEGSWRGAAPQPARYRLDGTWRGGRRAVALDWAGTTPRLAALEPPNSGEREEVPPALQRDTIDALSALAKLARSVAETGRCDLEAQVFDGRRRIDYTARTLGPTVLPAGGTWSGQALRCDIEGRLLAGFRNGQNTAEQREPQPATAWMVAVGPQRLPLPVLIEWPSRWFGTVRANLVAAAAVRRPELPAEVAQVPQPAPQPTGQQRR
jgi:hypothetical protein